ncbi:MAG: hypothetical protein ACTSO9_11325 [Candidatus Helarchaeota archaeon]
MLSYKTQNKHKINSKVRIDVNDKVIYIKLDSNINDKEAKNLVKYLEKLESQYNFCNFMIVLPKKWRWTQKARKILINFIKNKNFIITQSPIRRALLKTEATFAGENAEFICKSEIEALSKINQMGINFN